jgi:hypothetical protein
MDGIKYLKADILRFWKNSARIEEVPENKNLDKYTEGC